MDKILFAWNKTNRWHRSIFIILIVELRVFPGGQIGFTCNDPALAHPYTGDTISWKLLLVTTALLPMLVMLLVERKFHRDKPVKPKKQALRWYREYLFGTIINLLIIQVLKLIVGSPRPHFFDTCSPKEALTCDGSEYVPTYTCTKAGWTSQSDRSFPSGHTSLALHAGLFIAYYLHRRVSPRLTAVLAIQVLSIVTAVYCSISRITDRRHHWWDVCAGAVIALPILYYTIQHLCQNFECQTSKVGVTSDSNCDSNSNINTNNIGIIDTKATIM